MNNFVIFFSRQLNAVSCGHVCSDVFWGLSCDTDSSYDMTHQNGENVILVILTVACGICTVPQTMGRKQNYIL